MMTTIQNQGESALLKNENNSKNPRKQNTNNKKQTLNPYKPPTRQNHSN